jgi:carboxylesterase type B
MAMPAADGLFHKAIVQSGPYGGFAFMLKGLGIVGEAFAG